MTDLKEIPKENIKTEEKALVVEEQLSKTPVNELKDFQPMKVETENAQSQKNADHIKNHRRKRKKLKKIKKISPEHAEEIREVKYNLKKEEHWNNRFINDTIPDLFAKVKRKGRTANFLQLKKEQSPMKTYLVEGKDHNKLPTIYVNSDKNKDFKSKTTTEKPYHIRTLHKKEIQKHSSVQKEKGDTNQQPKVDQSRHEAKVDQSQHEAKVYQSQAPQGKEKKIIMAKTIKQQYEINLNELSKDLNMNFKEMLLFLNKEINEKKEKQVRRVIEMQLKQIIKGSSSFDKVNKIIVERNQIIENMKQHFDVISIDFIYKYQSLTLNLVEEILRYREYWEGIHSKVKSIGKKKIHLLIHAQNYLLEIVKSMKFAEHSGVADPFLIELASQKQSKESEDKMKTNVSKKEMMLKIRACQLLFLEEELNAKK